MSIRRILLSWCLIMLMAVNPQNPSSRRMSLDVDNRATTAQRFALREAQLAFNEAGLKLPPIEVLFSDDQSDCDGHMGYFRASAEPWQAVVCSELEFVVYHELAHAWLRASLTAEDRDRYLVHRGLQSWSSRSDDWRDRGVEDAAFIIQQNVMPRTSLPPLDGEWRQRIEAYEVLTERSSPLVAA